MSRVKEVYFNEYELLLQGAQEAHREKGEPIPQMYEENIVKIKRCLKVPFDTFDGKFLYGGFIDKAAILFYTMIKSHPLQNGNKRMAILTLVYFAVINNRLPSMSNTELYELATSTSSSDSGDKDMVITRLKKLFSRKLKVYSKGREQKRENFASKLRKSKS